MRIRPNFCNWTLQGLRVLLPHRNADKLPGKGADWASQMRLLCMGRLIPGAFQFLDRLAGRVSAKVNANAHCARESPKWPDTRGLRPRRIPELARALEPALILRAGRLHRPAAQRFLPLLRTPILPPLLVLLQMDHPAGPPFPRLLRPSCSSSPKRPCFHPWR